MEVDFREQNVRGVAELIFDHPALENRVTESGWWWGSHIVFEPAEHAANLTSLFRDAEDLRSRFSSDQLEQGFWYLISGAPGGLEDVLWNPEVPWETRSGLIGATVDLYRKLFADDPLDTSAYMFWDALAYGYGHATRHPQTDVEDRRIQEAMFVTLQQILAIDSLQCQRAALHGLGHLRHPDTKFAITNYLERHPELGDDDRHFAIACITGEIM